MSTQAQVRANQENAQHSTGPKTESGKAESSKNNFHRGLTGSAFYFLSSEDPAEFDHVLTGLGVEHQPATMTESILVENMARAYWLSKRAVRCQHACFMDGSLTMEDQSRRLSLFLRYQSTHDRAFHRNLTDLLKLRAEKRKQEIGFESQQHKQAQESRRDAAEKRKQDYHKLDVLLAEAKVDHQLLQNFNLEIANRHAAGAEDHSIEAQKAA